LGVGFGLYGAVVREWVDMGVRPWKTVLVGVEAHARYANPLWDLYSLMIVDTIESFLAGHNESYDAVLLLDVIEHFEKSRGATLLEEALRRVGSGGRLLVATPGEFVSQGAVYGNPRETHRSHWSVQDFLDRGFRILRDDQPDPFGGRTILAEWVVSS
jgi:hypothetical protein